MSLYGDDLENVSTNPSTEQSFQDVVASRFSRRTALKGGAATTLAFFAPALLGTGTAAADPRAKAARTPSGPLLGFTAISANALDDVSVAPGYTARPFLPWGTSLVSGGPAFRPGQNTSADQEKQVGMHHDGMHFFAKSKDGNRGLLVLNHEYTDEKLLQAGTGTRPSRAAITADQVRKSQAAHGVTVVEVERSADGTWTVLYGPKNRRITAFTPMAFSGPAAGHRLLQTAADPTGRRVLGTFNNCAHGYTPWGTYLTCEENFNGYFSRRNAADQPTSDLSTFSAEEAALLGRYGVNGDAYYWAERDERFRVRPGAANEPNRHGWVVEIDPDDPTSTPVKRTALGRIKHEGAFVHVTKGQRVVVYMGDDQVNEYAYKFVSSDNWKSLLARGKSPLDEGTLYVGKFNDDGSGEWLALVHGRPGLTAAEGFADQGDVLVKTRLAATSVGATRMHRPEWTGVDQNTGAVFLTLSNDGRSASAVRNGANPRTPNPWGSVIRWYEDGDDHAATTFRWDLLLLAGPGDGVDGSTVRAEDAFGSPDGLWVDRDSRVWVQTDGTQPGGANDQMMVVDPFTKDAQGRPEIKRFFTGVQGCEVTGCIDTPDQRTLFVNLQHPGDGGENTWPNIPADNGVLVPRSAVVVITKDDGGVIGT